MLLVATRRTTPLALDWAFGSSPPYSTSKLEYHYVEQAYRHIGWLYMVLQKPKISKKQVSTTCRAL